MPRDIDDGFVWFFRGHYEQVVRTAYLILRDREAARDVAQEAFLQLLRHWKKVSRYERPDAWVRRVAIRQAVKASRKARLQAHLRGEETYIDPSGHDPDLVAAISALPMRQRACVVLFYFEDRPIDEIALILECSGATVKVHLHRARKSLAHALGGEVRADVS